MVINTDPHDEEGEHWFSIYFDLIGKNRNKPSIYYFDSAKSIPSKEIISFIKKIKNDKQLGWVTRMISAKEISNDMLNKQINLNEISRDAAIELIDIVRSDGVNVTEVYVDTVGDPQKYENFLTQRFNYQISK